MCELPEERCRPYGGADLICDADVGSGIQGWLQAPCLALEGSARERHPYNTNFSLRPSLCIILQVAPLNRWVWLDFGPEQVGNGQNLWRIGWDPANYRTLTKRIIELVENSRFYLVEKPAAEIAGLCLADPQVERVTVRVAKPGAHRRRECPAHHPDFDVLRNDLLDVRCQWLVCLTARWLSKIPRIVEMFARRLQVQERMTRQIAGFLQETLDPLGVAALCESVHTCSATREVKNANARIVTSAMPGSLKSSQATREEFMPLSSGGMRRSTGSLGTGTAGCSLVPLGKRLDHESREKTRP